MVKTSVIIDCFTDEASGYGAPPFLSTHSRYLFGCLRSEGYKVFYLTFDDLRYAAKKKISADDLSSKKELRNTTKNRDRVKEIMMNCDELNIVLGRFVNYSYVSSVPPDLDELLSQISLFNMYKRLFYIMPFEFIESDFRIKLRKNFDEVITSPIINHFFNKEDHFTAIDQISVFSAEILDQLLNPIIVELETVMGCNHKPGCRFCAESLIKSKPQYRPVDEIVKEVQAFYKHGGLYFRLGKQPNFYNYMESDPKAYKELFQKIHKAAPKLRLLHIDNTSPQDIVTNKGVEITKLIVKYCSPGNVGSFGVESFDPEVREENNLNSNVKDIMDAIRIMNKYGSGRGLNGLPKLLPGLNLIYGLKGQNKDTWKINLEALKSIYKENLLTRRTFVRKLTSMSGHLEVVPDKDMVNFEHYKTAVNKIYSLPMIKRVIPAGTILKDVRSEIIQYDKTIFRHLATNPIRIIVNKKILPNTFANIKITSHIDGFTVRGELV